MFKNHILLLLGLVICPVLLPANQGLIHSPGNTTYFVNPVEGDDYNSGLDQEDAWKSFEPVNQRVFTCGDRIEITAPGSFDESLYITGSGCETAPIEVHFAPGRYNLFPDKMMRRKLNISNTNSYPDGDKAIGLFFENAQHVKVSGKGAKLVCRGKLIQVCIDRSEKIEIADLTFDYHRPTVSEFQVVATGKDYADIKIHPDSDYVVKNGRIEWIGEGWFYTQAPLMQILDPESNLLRRSRNKLNGLKIEDIEPFLVRAHGAHSFKEGWIYHLRNTERDYAGVFVRRSKNVAWRDVNFQFLHGMGLVSQFSENLRFEGVRIAPDPESGRTCAGWADGIHVSGCRGKVTIKDCFFSGLQDDAINIHGTHLRVVEKLSETQVKVRFMHNQTFGFMAFNPGDKITLTRWDSLENYGPNTVKEAVLLEPKVMLLTMEKPLPSNMNENDAVENITWTPEAEITGNKVMRVPTRGFLITTRRNVLVEDNSFYRTNMSAILIENDAKGWFESGPVRDMTIRGNRFFYCREPVINLNPQNNVSNPGVHRNIRIHENAFALNNQVAVKARSTKAMKVSGNSIYSEKPNSDAEAVITEDSAEIQTNDNRYLPLNAWPYEFMDSAP